MGENVCLSSGLDNFFKPRSIAVVGASSDPNKLGFKLVHNIKEGGFKGKIVPVNLKGSDVDGIPSVSSIGEVDGEIELAMICLPSKFVKEALVQVGQKGIPYAIIVSAGFRESGNLKGEAELVDIAHRYGVRLLGPNVFGIIYTPSDLNAQFGPGDVMKGKVAIITQSGALGAALMGKVFEEGIGVSGVVSTGNKADISDEELLEFFCSDPNTQAILMYVEGLKDGRKFMDIVSDVSRLKPIIIVKSGTTEEGARAVRSHTASLAGSDKVFDGAFKQSGVLRAPTIKDAIDWTRTLIDLPPPQKKEVLLITNGGGLGAIAVDWLTKNGIPLFKDIDWIKREMGPIFPPYATMDNPVDITAQVPWDIYLKGLKKAIDEDRIGSVMGIYSPTSGADVDDFTRGIVETIGIPKKPVMIVTFGGSASMKQIQDLKKHQIPAFYYPEEAVSSLVTLYRYGDHVKSSPTKNTPHIAWDIQGIVENETGFLGVEQGLRILENGPIQTAQWKLVETEEDLRSAVEGMEYPVVLKTADRDIVHKTESGGVITGITSEDQLFGEFRNLKRISSKMILMKQVNGLELIVGGLRDPVFGPVVMFGVGGIMVEAMNDVQFRVAPLNRTTAMDMIGSLKSVKLLNGFRNLPSIDRDEIADILIAIGDLVVENATIDEIEINPLISTREGPMAVDARIKVNKPQ